MENEEKVIENVTFQLKGADALLFRRYKEIEFLERNAEAGRKLFFERLTQWAKEKKIKAA